MSKLDEHRALVTAFYHTFSLADVTQFDDLRASDWINHPAAPGRESNREGFKGGLQDFHGAFENFHIHIDAIVAENDLIVCRITMSGRHIGTLAIFSPQVMISYSAAWICTGLPVEKLQRPGILNAFLRHYLYEPHNQHFDFLPT